MMTGEKYFMDALERIPPEITKRVDWSMGISDRLSGLLSERGLSQKDFAKLMSRSEPEVSRWLGGQHNFTLATLAKISAVLGTDLIAVTK